MSSKKWSWLRTLLAVVILLNTLTYSTGAKEETLMNNENKQKVVVVSGGDRHHSYLGTDINLDPNKQWLRELVTDKMVDPGRIKYDDAVNTMSLGIDLANGPDFTGYPKGFFPEATPLRDLADLQKEHILSKMEALQEETLVSKMEAAIRQTNPEAVTRNIYPRQFLFPEEERVCLLIDEVCRELGFDRPSLIKAMVYCESGFDKTQISSADARGLMQITPRWFSKLMAEYEVTDLCADERGNLLIGVRWIQYLIHKYGDDTHKVLVAYNLGESRVDRGGITQNGFSTKVLRIEGEYL